MIFQNQRRKKTTTLKMKNHTKKSKRKRKDLIKLWIRERSLEEDS
jgi:hypothetical protein